MHASDAHWNRMHLSAQRLFPSSSALHPKNNSNRAGNNLAIEIVEPASMPLSSILIIVVDGKVLRPRMWVDSLLNQLKLRAWSITFTTNHTEKAMPWVMVIASINLSGRMPHLILMAVMLIVRVIPKWGHT